MMIEIIPNDRIALNILICFEIYSYQLRTNTDNSAEKLYMELTLLRTLQNPVNWSVAPNKESITLPDSPARVESGITSS